MLKTRDKNKIPVKSLLVEEKRFIENDKEITEFFCYEKGDQEVESLVTADKVIDACIEKHAKHRRIKHDISKIKTTSTNNNEFDCCEQSQERIARKILTMNDTEKVKWKLTDNKVVNVDKAELTEVLKHAMIEQELILLE